MHTFEEAVLDEENVLVRVGLGVVGGSHNVAQVVAPEGEARPFEVAASGSIAIAVRAVLGIAR